MNKNWKSNIYKRYNHNKGKLLKNMIKNITDIMRYIRQFYNNMIIFNKKLIVTNSKIMNNLNKI